MEKNVSEEKLQVFSLLIDGPFIFSMDKRLISQNNDYSILMVMMKTFIANYSRFDHFRSPGYPSHGQAVNYAVTVIALR